MRQCWRQTVLGFHVADQWCRCRWGRIWCWRLRRIISFQLDSQILGASLMANGEKKINIFDFIRLWFDSRQYFTCQYLNTESSKHLRRFPFLCHHPDLVRFLIHFVRLGCPLIRFVLLYLGGCGYHICYWVTREESKLRRLKAIPRWIGCVYFRKLTWTEVMCGHFAMYLLPLGLLMMRCLMVCNKNRKKAFRLALIAHFLTVPIQFVTVALFENTSTRIRTEHVSMSRNFRHCLVIRRVVHFVVLVRWMGCADSVCHVLHRTADTFAVCMVQSRRSIPNCWGSLANHILVSSCLTAMRMVTLLTNCFFGVFVLVHVTVIALQPNVHVRLTNL